MEIVAKIGPLLGLPAGIDEIKDPVDVVFPEDGDVLLVEGGDDTALCKAKGAAVATESIETALEPGEEEENPPFIVKFPHAMIVLLA